MAGNGIPTVAELEAHIGEPGATKPAQLATILAGVLDLIGTRAGGVYIGPATSRAVILDGGGGREHRHAAAPANLPRGKLVVYLPHPPAGAAAVSVVEVRDQPGGAWRALAGSDWLQEGRLVRRAGGLEWPGFPASVRVTYLAGYNEANPMPPGIALGALDGAAAEWRQRVKAQPGLEVLDGPQTPRMPQTFWQAVDALKIPPTDF